MRRLGRFSALGLLSTVNSHFSVPTKLVYSCPPQSLWKRMLLAYLVPCSSRSSAQPTTSSSFLLECLAGLLAGRASLGCKIDSRLLGDGFAGSENEMEPGLELEGEGCEEDAGLELLLPLVVVLVSCGEDMVLAVV